jgi:hypothetical protein
MVEGTNNAQITSGWNDDVINYIIKEGDIIVHGPAVSVAQVLEAASSTQQAQGGVWQSS